MKERENLHQKTDSLCNCLINWLNETTTLNVIGLLKCLITVLW